MDLSKVSTNELVEELKKREGVEAISVEPYGDYHITVGDKQIADQGPAVILRICD